MLMVNSSINFIIYCAFGSKFRRVVMEKLYPNFYNVRSRHTNSNGLDVVRTNENNLVSVFRILMKVMIRYRPRFFDQVGHQTTYASMGN